MSGGNVSYNLRPNKFVERQLFAELLNKVCARYSPDRYVYVSLGGPQLEDQRLVHRRLGIKTLISLEMDPVIHKRQLFNQRPSFVECRNESTGDFISNFDAFADLHEDKKFIIWFDYASPRERHEQLVEYQTLLGKLEAEDIIKITMNANPGTLGEEQIGETKEQLQKRRLKALRNQLDIYLPKSLKYTEMTGRGLARILCNAIKKASLNAVQNTHLLKPIPLAIFVYQDGPHQILTVTVQLVLKADVEQFRKKLLSQGWDYLPSSWEDVTKIKVPNLTAKERLFIEGLLFSKSHENVHKELPFRFHENEKESLRILEEYARHYRWYPSYFQVVL